MHENLHLYQTITKYHRLRATTLRILMSSKTDSTCIPLLLQRQRSTLKHDFASLSLAPLVNAFQVVPTFHGGPDGTNVPL
jgi:hypothetical protein